MLYMNSFCSMYSVCICSWWWDVHTCIYFVSSVVFVDFLIKSSSQKKSNRLLRLFHHCSVDVKLALFRSYCTCFYCPFLWTHYKKSNYSKLRVAFNNVYRRILKLPSRSSASTMYVVNNIDSLEVLVRKRIFGFMERVNNSDNTIIKCINNSWILRVDIWRSWNDLLFIH